MAGWKGLWRPVVDVAEKSLAGSNDCEHRAS